MYKSGLMELEAVVAIARLGSFRAAASDLDVSPTAIGNAVASLENRLGVRLFNRTTRNVALTSAGREYVEAIAPALSDIRTAAQAVADHSRKPTGNVSHFRSAPNSRHWRDCRTSSVRANAQSRCAPARCAGARAERPVAG
jgi:DNA-binding transcriptional LysR family regulator